MKIGIPREIKNHEGRVGLDPKHVFFLVRSGEEVFVEWGAGELSGFSDAMYEGAGARMTSQQNVWAQSDMVIKVKEPLESEYEFLRPHLSVMAFFHFSGNPELRKICKKKKVISIPYENLKIGDRYPILSAMSVIAGEYGGRVVVSKHFLKKRNGRRIHMEDAAATIIGMGTAGKAAFQMLYESGVKRFFVIDERTVPAPYKDIFFVSGSPAACNIVDALAQSDIVIGAVRTTKGAPKLITRSMLANMEPFSLFVDISIDEGGISETSRPTSHSNPTYIEEGVVHYCVPNIPGIVPDRSTPALIEGTFQLIEEYIQKKKARFS
ncbi:MAG: alanine dehydrogenase [Candidatus Niyogibacteria bacterium CG10_big_fil_rev_8_21_14_0_10_46_36]|uniref:Alanine dehydrogenase n=1 Tax=Candidatus Niyogibacteria bacterium CG10_big_fil_rev_8_21_14_0_10_46_36 TaxID=1974726 RepID=A0A2H0TDL4_9BACT|nr:MAG: alanine dehydrogenase [Candidatus Niyogibacteria bacterium CG10_big_fil_rev_8_21_14_0_10_46_36]